MKARFGFAALLALAALAQEPPAYEGREPEAAWRKQAAERIGAIRKAALTVEVRDANGNPVSGAQLHVRMKRHAYWFGSAVSAEALAKPGSDGDRYRREVASLFNCAVLENDLKWPQWEADKGRALVGLEWLRQNGITRVRGHNLIWPGWKWMPAGARTLSEKPEQLRTRILDHIAEEAQAVRGKVAEWDVVNEPFTNTDVQKILGDAELIRWYQAAHTADPAAALFLNDFNILSAGGADGAHQQHFSDTIQMLIDGAAPLDGIGMQGHFGKRLTAPVRVWEVLDRFAKFGKPIRVTEFDINIVDQELQGAYTRDFMTAFFSHPSTTGFLMWGFWEGRHWRPDGAMFRRDWSLKPNGEVYKDLVFREWWTDLRGASAQDGRLSARGFLGDYEVDVTWNGVSKRMAFVLDKAGALVRVTIP